VVATIGASGTCATKNEQEAASGEDKVGEANEPLGLGAVGRAVPHCDHRQALDRPEARSAELSDPLGLDRQLEVRPRRILKFERAFAFGTRELTVEAVARAERNVAIWAKLELRVLGKSIGRHIHVGGRQHGHDPIAIFEPGAA
jgi:hypothetical protein